MVSTRENWVEVCKLSSISFGRFDSKIKAPCKSTGYMSRRHQYIKKSDPP
jgi:hypothetical protein